ncbi:MAG: DUF262 domain-containing protein [Bacteroides sp.]|nr:DUF262 domain-containing protein [Bacteroides sp.]
MTNEFIYNIKNIFSYETGSLFNSTKTKMFYIGPYQRSYKWQSEGKFDQVPQLLNDIYDAWSNNPDSEYYLQYITVKTDSDRQWLEVIDGQQRLTTLTLLFYQLSEINAGDNIAKGKIKYSRYENRNIFEEIRDYCKSIQNVEEMQFNEQDTYYMVAASLCIRKKLEEWQSKGILIRVKNFLMQNVKIIVNIESNFVKSEEIFANLNDNHVPLTDAYLIKGLLLTNAVSRVNAYGRSLEFTEVEEKRKNLGRIWDEIQTWITNKEHSHFFFKNTKIGEKYDLRYSMEYFLELAYLYKFEAERNDHVIEDYSQNRLELFNKFNSRIKTAEDASGMIEIIRHIYRKLVTIYDGPLYNLWGFVQFSKSLLADDCLDIYAGLDMSEEELEHNLASLAVKRIPDLKNIEICKDNYSIMRYRSKNDKLTNLLLSFSVFSPMRASRDFKFGFYEYDNSKWSFEHISPQNPKGVVSIPGYAKIYVITALEKKLGISNLEDNEKVRLQSVINSVKNGEKIDADAIDFLFDYNLDEHSLGNMALLTREDNSANNNNPFMIKKLIIQNKKGTGAFIPSHTYDVFNKIQVSPAQDKPFSAETFLWSQQDVDAHIKWMEYANEDILNWLKKR